MCDTKNIRKIETFSIVNYPFKNDKTIVRVLKNIALK